VESGKKRQKQRTDVRYQEKQISDVRYQERLRRKIKNTKTKTAKEIITLMFLF